VLQEGQGCVAGRYPCQGQRRLHPCEPERDENSGTRAASRTAPGGVHSDAAFNDTGTRPRERNPQKSGGHQARRIPRAGIQHVKESHQTVLEELETSNEELKSANEELQSINEELQSTNEELETSKEEMQSLNEELTTVNAELQSKVDELSRTNDDMQNLLNSTDIATVFLDNGLNIKRFTDKAKELVTLRPTDVGRPISDLSSNVQYEGLANDCREVLQTLVQADGSPHDRRQMVSDADHALPYCGKRDRRHRVDFCEYRSIERI
jgi:hypothetical protein